MKVLTTLAENEYFLGLSALINSIVKQGTYVDKIVVGYRGDLPAWLPPLTDTSQGRKVCTLPSNLPLEFIKLDGSLHMVHEKPKWFKFLTFELEPDADEFFFFDSDIVVIKRMSFFGEWIQQGVALCEDVNFDMSIDHPIRKQWIKLAEKSELVIQRNLQRYYNSGFLGWTRQHAEFIDDWDKSFKCLAQVSADMKAFRSRDRTYPVQSANQDSLNLAAMITNRPISTMGPSAMGFATGLKLMSHPIGLVRKPWKRNYFKEFLDGSPPTPGDLIYWEHVNGTELKPYKSNTIKSKQRSCKVFKGLARIYKKI